MKVCTKCGLEKPLDEFNKKTTGKYAGYVYPTCRSCSYSRDRQYGHKQRYDKSPRKKARYHERQVARAGRSPASNCEICGEEYTETPCYDHDHGTGAFRGWICRKCNVSLGLAGDNPAVLEAMVAYLRARGFTPTRG